MFFTQDDYKKIQQWLIKNSVKDTEFSEANIPFNGEETITIVQGNQNKKVFLKDLVSQVFNLGISDFVNITDKYNAPNITLEEAIRLIPSRARKEGQVITFLNKEDGWNIYQFKGVLNQWNVLDKWEDLFDWEKLIIDSILPDEEDLTKSLPDENGNSYLSLKDREYNPEDFSGLGRVILRKNIVEVEDPIYGKVKKNYLYQDMFTQSNTVYEIRYDFDLNNQTITIPENCILKYKGGSLNNGHIVYQNTKIQGIESLNNITTEGLFAVIDAAIDEEDLHNNNGVLKFADREYNPNAFSGLGKIILRKNIVNGKNILIQDKINKSNTIYIIQYDFDLNGQEITIPEGCVLDFQGGSLNNGSIIGNGTSINSTLSAIFKENLSIKGSFNTYGHITWFGASITKEDNSDAIQHCLNSFEKVIIDEGTYKLTKGIVVNKNTIIKGSDAEYNNCTLLFKLKNASNKIAITINNKDFHTPYLSIIGITISTDNSDYTDGYVYQENTTAIYTTISIEMFYCNINGFEKSIESNGKTFYNKFCFNRIENTKYCLYYLYSNNIQFIGNRVQHFDTFVTRLFGNGPVNITNNSFEFFSGYLINTYYEVGGTINFTGNYVEIYNTALPKGFTNNNEGKYGGNFLFSGNIHCLNVSYNELQIEHAKRVFYNTYAKRLYSIGNHLPITEQDALLQYYFYIDGNGTKKIEEVIIKDSSSLLETPVNYNGINISNSAYSSSIKIIDIIDCINGSVKCQGKAIQYSGNSQEEIDSLEKPVGTLFTLPNGRILSWNSKEWKNVLGEGYDQEYQKRLSKKSTVPESPQNFDNYFDTSVDKVAYYLGGDRWVDSMGFIIARKRGDSNTRPSNLSFVDDRGYLYWDTQLLKPIWFTGNDWVDANGNNPDFKTSGQFDNKPLSPSIGFAYFCTNRQTAEGATNGIMIYHKGNNVWVDALGRVVE